MCVMPAGIKLLLCCFPLHHGTINLPPEGIRGNYVRKAWDLSLKTELVIHFICLMDVFTNNLLRLTF